MTSKEGKPTLSNEQRNKIFTMYWGQRVLKFSKTAPATQLVIPETMYRLTKDCYLSLTPLSKISDEDAIECYKIRWSEITKQPTPSQCKYQLSQDWNEKWFLYDVYQYLTQKQYDVPLFIEVGHPANGMTAIDLNIATDKTLQP